MKVNRLDPARAHRLVLRRVSIPTICLIYLIGSVVLILRIQGVVGWLLLGIRYLFFINLCLIMIIALIWQEVPVIVLSRVWPVLVIHSLPLNFTLVDVGVEVGL